MKINFQKIKKTLNKDIAWQCPVFKKKRSGELCSVNVNRRFLWVFLFVIFLVGFGAGGFYARPVLNSAGSYLRDLTVQIGFSPNWPWLGTKANPGPSGESEQAISEYKPQTSQEEAVINVVKNASKAVVSVIITKKTPVYETYYEEESPLPDDFFGTLPFKIQVPKQRQIGTKDQRIGEGTGFIVSSDGLVLTNKHVVADKDAQYTVVTTDGKIYPVKVLARDPFQDLAIMKIEQEQQVVDSGSLVAVSFPILKLGDSDDLQIGQTVITIGNALGELTNTVSVGVISGLSRTITASGGGISETLEDIIQTDAAINPGNSGGPLLNLKGEVIGVNVAMANGAQSIGFTVPSSKAKKDITDIQTKGKIVYAFLGVRHSLITPDLQAELKLPVDYGSLIAEGDKNEPAVTPGSSADKAGLKSGDIILEVASEKVTRNNSLGKIIQKHQPGETISLKIMREDKEMTIDVVLGEKTSDE
ncbi:MAG: trypsin-like peptidase domain-containing protein [Candidatus Pacebacteria bacterium]|nr:trypsin-like peptidase domain-containing protein [Candidatus Paceibacterota bacterium]